MENDWSKATKTVFGNNNFQTGDPNEFWYRKPTGDRATLHYSRSIAQAGDIWSFFQFVEIRNKNRPIWQKIYGILLLLVLQYREMSCDGSGHRSSLSPAELFWRSMQNDWHQRIPVGEDVVIYCRHPPPYRWTLLTCIHQNNVMVPSRIEKAYRNWCDVWNVGVGQLSLWKIIFECTDTYLHIHISLSS
jgi:hypothetical protein